MPLPVSEFCVKYYVFSQCSGLPTAQCSREVSMHKCAGRTDGQTDRRTDRQTWSNRQWDLVNGAIVHVTSSKQYWTRVWGSKHAPRWYYGLLLSAKNRLTACCELHYNH